MIEDLPDVQDIEYLITNIHADLDLNGECSLSKALNSCFIQVEEVKKGETWNRNGVLYKYAQLTFSPEIEHTEVINSNLKKIMSACEKVLNYHGYRHVQWKPIIKFRPVPTDKHLYEDRNMISYSGCFYRSKSEVKIAKALENRGVNFIANGRGRFQGNAPEAKTLEPDFLVIYNNKIAVLEVDGDEFHDDKLKQVKRDELLKDSGFHFIAHYSAERCYTRPNEVVEAFLQQLIDIT